MPDATSPNSYDSSESSTEAVAVAEQVDEREEVAREATGAVYLGLCVSAVRCILTYVVAPIAGVFGIVLGPFGAILQIVGAVFATYGARRLWLLRHRMWIPYALVALAVDILAVWAIIELVNDWRS